MDWKIELNKCSVMLTIGSVSSLYKYEILHH